jgi:hypothetical protein
MHRALYPILHPRIWNLVLFLLFDVICAMQHAPFPHQLRHEALAAIKNDPPFAFLEIRAWAAAEPDV